MGKYACPCVERRTTRSCVHAHGTQTIRVNEAIRGANVTDADVALEQRGLSGAQAPWYSEVTRYQWLVLAIASAGWVFDAFEGQIFNLTRNDLLTDLLKVSGSHPDVKLWGDIFLGVFLAGGTFGGILFGSLADRWGRRPTMVVTILFYSIFS